VILKAKKHPIKVVSGSGSMSLLEQLTW
jgi:hypothetical protein